MFEKLSIIANSLLGIGGVFFDGLVACYTLNVATGTGAHNKGGFLDYYTTWVEVFGRNHIPEMKYDCRSSNTERTNTQYLYIYTQW